jgi:FlaA1/EpsC-like NDP-sugar epimerase
MGERVLIYGAGDSGETLLNMITKFDDLHYRPIGFIDDDPEKQNYMISRYRILGTVYNLESICRQNSISRVIISTRYINGNREAILRDFCKKRGVAISKFKVSVEDY